MANKERIDVLLVKLGFFDTRERAKRAIMAGLIYINNEKVYKPGEKVDIAKEITVKGKKEQYVSRGGYKLEKAIEYFQIDLKDKIMLDIGASTGGFTDCALQNGVRLVYALDVGYNQLSWQIRSHNQVIVIERCNFRYATLDLFLHGQPEFATIDVSFISLKLILPILHSILIDNGYVVALIKPQFEAGREFVGKKGIIRDPNIHKQVLKDILDFAYNNKYSIIDLTYSPIKGTEGNIEFLVYLQKTNKPMINKYIDINKIISESHDLK